MCVCNRPLAVDISYRNNSKEEEMARTKFVGVRYACACSVGSFFSSLLSIENKNSITAKIRLDDGERTNDCSSRLPLAFERAIIDSFNEASKISTRIVYFLLFYSSSVIEKLHNIEKESNTRIIHSKRKLKV